MKEEKIREIITAVGCKKKEDNADSYVCKNDIEISKIGVDKWSIKTHVDIFDNTQFKSLSLNPDVIGFGSFRRKNTYTFEYTNDDTINIINSEPSLEKVDNTEIKDLFGRLERAKSMMDRNYKTIDPKKIYENTLAEITEKIEREYENELMQKIGDTIICASESNIQYVWSRKGNVPISRIKTVCTYPNISDKITKYISSLMTRNIIHDENDHYLDVYTDSDRKLYLSKFVLYDKNESHPYIIFNILDNDKFFKSTESVSDMLMRISDTFNEKIFENVGNIVKKYMDVSV